MRFTPGVAARLGDKQLITKAHHNAFEKRRLLFMKTMLPLAATAPQEDWDQRFAWAEVFFEPTFANRHVFFDRLTKHATARIRWTDEGEANLSTIIHAAAKLYEHTQWKKKYDDNGTPIAHSLFPITRFLTGAIAFVEIARPLSSWQAK